MRVTPTEIPAKVEFTEPMARTSLHERTLQQLENTECIIYF